MSATVFYLHFAKKEKRTLASSNHSNLTLRIEDVYHIAVLPLLLHHRCLSLTVPPNRRCNDRQALSHAQVTNICPCSLHTISFPFHPLTYGGQTPIRAKVSLQPLLLTLLQKDWVTRRRARPIGYTIHTL